MVTTFYPPYHFGGDGIFVRGLARALADLCEKATARPCACLLTLPDAAGQLSGCRRICRLSRRPGEESTTIGLGKMGNRSAPELSVMVLMPDNYETIRAQTVRDRLEIVTVVPSADYPVLDQSER